MSIVEPVGQWRYAPHEPFFGDLRHRIRLRRAMVVTGRDQDGLNRRLAGSTGAGATLPRRRLGPSYGALLLRHQAKAVPDKSPGQHPGICAGRLDCAMQAPIKNERRGADGHPMDLLPNLQRSSRPYGALSQLGSKHLEWPSKVTERDKITRRVRDKSTPAQPIPTKPTAQTTSTVDPDYQIDAYRCSRYR